MPPGTTKDNFDFGRQVRAVAGADFDIEIEHIGFWDLRFAVADTYGDGRIFIAGDAAHSHPPYDGYGVNLGLDDARNLGWKLAAVLQGWAGPELLASYSRERQPVFRSTARDFIEKANEADRKFLAEFSPERDRAAFEREWQARSSGARSEVNAFEPNYEGSPIVWGPPGGTCSALGTHAFAARAGHHLAPQPLTSGRNVFEELGEGLTLLGLGADDSACEAFTAAAARMHVPLRVVRDSRDGGRERCEAGFVLVRPDQFVAWTSDDAPADPATILGKAIGSG
ncbi:MAG: FAD-dependent monooxygenase [Hyphomicrobiaceae bacterium]